jgi:glycosyltransferase involved in cell wall biosynthesis
MALMIFLYVYFLFLLLLVFVGFFLQLRKEKQYALSIDSAPLIDLSDLVVLVPFRNEKERIGGLLTSIIQSNILPSLVVFIDDHSSDDTSTYIRELLPSSVPFVIHKLPIGLEGKKQALRFGLENNPFTYILTLDADVVFPATFFESIARLSECDMYVLPVIFQAKKWLHYFFEQDVSIANAANVAISGWKRPILASGANLLFKHSAYDKFNKLESHVKIASGDDIFLLRDFRENAAKIRVITQLPCAVYTQLPNNFSELFHQRVRWISKTGKVKDSLSSILAVTQAVFTIIFLVILLQAVFLSHWDVFWRVILFKTFVDWCCFLPYFFRNKRYLAWSLLPFYEWIFPFYTFLILGAMVFFHPKWKGRKL